MSRAPVIALVAAVTIAVVFRALVSPAPARALGSIGTPCTSAGAPAIPGCSALGGGGIVSNATDALTAVTLVAVGAWVADGARFVLGATAKVLTETTGPQLKSTWFSGTYWRVAGVATVLTLPFLFAAAIQALVRSDLSLLVRAALGYLPMALLAVAIAAPLTMLLLAASDQMSSVVSSAASNQGVDFLERAVGLLGGLATGVSAPFVVFLVGLVTVAGGLVLWMELLVREAAIYVIVLMLPLAFAAFVWPARRIWAIRAIELLVALILSKFVIVAVLSLGGAALDHSVNRSVTGELAGGVLMALAAFAPWALLRLIPLAEIASSAAASLGAGRQAALHRLQQSDAWATEGLQWITKMTQMREPAPEPGRPAAPPSPRAAEQAAAGALQPPDPAAAGALQPADPAAAGAPQPPDPAATRSPRAAGSAQQTETPAAESRADDAAWILPPPGFDIENPTAHDPPPEPPPEGSP